MNLIALPAFTDNYIWMLHDGQRALVVDPGDAEPVRAALLAQGLELSAILVTHHHPDHVAGIAALRDLLRGPVYGPARERIPVPFEPLRDGDQIEVVGCRFEVIDVPGHTAGHIAFVHRPTDGAAPILFCGDTLFSGGCGRLFEGTATQMHESLSRLAALPGDTRVCCAHEYTQSNLRFAQAVEPDNAALADHVEHCRALRAQGLPTLPSSIGLELQINPFMRCMQAPVVAAALGRGASDDSGAAVLGALREWKNEYR
ncbi:MAG: hydroxyacylglutathione hydrolase [Ideonella sp.]|jgi:hydroxyacylglutathione hydrolase|nr:hydroxyacylglutathione hydrolase [Ideonella sp.]MBL0147978.1 hydroxyacylglutathione hydrolase [Ideonella sp.]